jgi:hypothetical protein
MNWWVIAAFVIGAYFGALLMALAVMAHQDQQEDYSNEWH